MADATVPEVAQPSGFEAGIPDDTGSPVDGGRPDATDGSVPEGGDGGDGGDANDSCGNECGDGGTCNAGRCYFNCTTANPCANPTCPGTHPCTFNCVGTGACGANNINCTNCDVICRGFHACAGNVDCTGADCNILCCGDAGACKGNATCHTAGCSVVCDVTVDGGQACGGNRTCPGTCPDSGLSCE